MAYWFIFNKGGVMLEKCDDDSFTIPCSDCAPVATDDTTHILNVSPMDATVRTAFRYVCIHLHRRTAHTTEACVLVPIEQFASFACFQIQRLRQLVIRLS